MAKAPSRSQTQTAASEEAPPKRRKRSGGRSLFVACAITVLVTGIGGGAAWYFTAGQSQAAVVREPTYMQLDTFTVNLQSERGREFLQTTLSVKLSDAGAEALLRTRMPEVRNRVLLLLGAKRAPELASPQSREALATELAAEMKKTLAGDPRAAGIDAVLFTTFVIQ